jgi:hypothetical protein
MKKVLAAGLLVGAAVRFDAGSMSYAQMPEILRGGSATAASDSGIDGRLPLLI